MKLYELTESFAELFSQFEDINEYEPDTDADGQPIDGNGDIIEDVEAYKEKMLTAWFDTLEGIEGEFDEKAESIAIYIKQLKAEANILKFEKSAIAKRQSQKEREVEKLVAYLLNAMKAIGRSKVDMPHAVVSIRNNAPSLIVDDEISFIEWAEEHNLAHLLKYSMPEVKKNDVKALCKKGEEIPFVHMEAKQLLSEVLFMGLPILVLGYSGSGKSASLRNFKANELALVNVNGKSLPFRTKFTSSINSDNYIDIEDFIKKQKCKSIAIDDAQYLMANEYMRRAKETGFQKFTDIGKNFWELVKQIETLPSDTIVYFLSHIDTDENGRQKAKTIGKLLDEKISVEGMFTTVLKTVVVDGKYLFATQTDGNDTCKSPIGLFDSMYISNDLKIVDEALRTYYSMQPEQYCDECKAPILSDGKRTVKQIIDGTTKNYGRQLCMQCVAKLIKQKKQEKQREGAGNAASTVSE